VRYSSRVDLRRSFCSCCGSVMGLRRETPLPAGLKRTPCEAAGEPGRRLPERSPAARRLSSHSELRGRAVPAARRQRAAAPGDRLVGLGPLHEQIARSRDGGLVGHALGAKRVAIGCVSPGRFGLASGAPHDGVGVSARGLARIDLDADSWG
jgi:hypothetical protein